MHFDALHGRGGLAVQRGSKATAGFGSVSSQAAAEFVDCQQRNQGSGEFHDPVLQATLLAIVRCPLVCAVEAAYRPRGDAAAGTCASGACR